MDSAREEIRPGRVEDAQAICDLVNYHAERGKMLHRSLESVYEALRDFLVAVDGDGRVVGCAAVDVFWGDLAEIKSLAVAPDAQKSGTGRRLVQAGIADARRLGTKKLFALTYETEFFAKEGFEVIDRRTLPEKVWGECLACPKSDACDETAMMLQL